jgi:hypothetical protein
MPPAPASIAAAPSPRSSVSWNPAVPPPPVTGAALGTWLAAGLTVTVAVTVVVAAWGAGAAAVEVEVEPGIPAAELLPDADVLPLGATAVRDPPDEVVTVGEKAGTVGVDVDEPEVQAETATGASKIRAAHQRVVSLTTSGLPAIVPRTFMDPPPAPLLRGADEDCVSRSRRQKPVPERKRVTGLVAARAATGRSRKRGRP